MTWCLDVLSWIYQITEDVIPWIYNIHIKVKYDSTNMYHIFTFHEHTRWAVDEIENITKDFLCEYFHQDYYDYYSNQCISNHMTWPIWSWWLLVILLIWWPNAICWVNATVLNITCDHIPLFGRRSSDFTVGLLRCTITYYPLQCSSIYMPPYGLTMPQRLNNDGNDIKFYPG